MKIKRLFKVVLVFSLLISGCASSQGRRSESIEQERIDQDGQRELARDLIRQDWNAFMSFSRMNFSDRVSRDFQPDKQIFLSDAEHSFFNSTPVDLTFSIDQVLPTNEKLAVTITWQKKTADRNTGTLNFAEGECMIVYIKENNQWRIYSIQGNSIFAL